eukprot:CAMPEP_0113480608 /NCGR_PEP_ID=MMETSP0014_2-20120614/21965_1 /TAXON_ID=2857 /ORGANISM="Nitzschia sp." /LENGTH=217 /DNA_ID=CAMNT_0000374047 /DNA_START=1068 /DNA_END=1721 /DNA_ORIENTATION=- /assembly_acc=CAM_ASM_000159
MTAKYIYSSTSTNGKNKIAEGVLKLSDNTTKNNKDLVPHARDERRRRQRRRVKQLSTLEGMEIEEWRLEHNYPKPQQLHLQQQQQQQQHEQKNDQPRINASSNPNPQPKLQDVTNKQSITNLINRQSPSPSSPSKHTVTAVVEEDEDDEDDVSTNKSGGRFSLSLFRLMSNNSSERSQSSNDESNEAENGRAATIHRSSRTTTRRSPLRYVSTAWAA